MIGLFGRRFASVGGTQIAPFIDTMALRTHLVLAVSLGGLLHSASLFADQSSAQKPKVQTGVDCGHSKLKEEMRGLEEIFRAGKEICTVDKDNKMECHYVYDGMLSSVESSKDGKLSLAQKDLLDEPAILKNVDQKAATIAFTEPKIEQNSAGQASEQKTEKMAYVVSDTEVKKVNVETGEEQKLALPKDLKLNKVDIAKSAEKIQQTKTILDNLFGLNQSGKNALVKGSANNSGYNNFVNPTSDFANEAVQPSTAGASVKREGDYVQMDVPCSILSESQIQQMHKDGFDCKHAVAKPKVKTEVDQNFVNAIRGYGFLGGMGRTQPPVFDPSVGNQTMDMANDSYAKAYPFFNPLIPVSGGNSSGGSSAYSGEFSSASGAKSRASDALKLGAPEDKASGTSRFGNSNAIIEPRDEAMQAAMNEVMKANFDQAAARVDGKNDQTEKVAEDLAASASAEASLKEDLSLAGDSRDADLADQLLIGQKATSSDEDSVSARARQAKSGYKVKAKSSSEAQMSSAQRAEESRRKLDLPFYLKTPLFALPHNRRRLQSVQS